MALFGFPQEAAQPLARSYTNTAQGGRRKGGDVSQGEREKKSSRRRLAAAGTPARNEKQKRKVARWSSGGKSRGGTQSALLHVNMALERIWTELD